jgi:hypothetical protein
MSVEAEYRKVLERVQKEFPRFRIEQKSKSWFMKLLNVLLLIVTFGQQRTFMTGFVTTIGHYMWVPGDWEEQDARMRAAILRHEAVHLRQQRRFTFPVYAAMYLLFPLPIGLAWGRAYLERQAYEESIRAYAEYFGQRFFTEAVRRSIVGHFTSAEYGWMWPFRRAVERWYDHAVAMTLPY